MPGSPGPITTFPAASVSVQAKVSGSTALPVWSPTPFAGSEAETNAVTDRPSSATVGRSAKSIVGGRFATVSDRVRVAESPPSSVTVSETVYSPSSGVSPAKTPAAPADRSAGWDTRSAISVPVAASRSSQVARCSSNRPGSATPAVNANVPPSSNSAGPAKSTIVGATLRAKRKPVAVADRPSSSVAVRATYSGPSIGTSKVRSGPVPAATSSPNALVTAQANVSGSAAPAGSLATAVRVRASPSSIGPSGRPAIATVGARLRTNTTRSASATPPSPSAAVSRTV